MNKIMKGLAGILAGCAVMGSVALAGGAAAVLETFTGESEVSVYIKGAGPEEEVSVQIATAEAGRVRVRAQSISELDVPLQTLVMVDNSLSISKDNRGKINEFLQNLISDRLNKEEICIATFSEDINKLTDYTSDYGTLKKAADSIAYQDQETYLTDVLYDLISAEYADSAEDVYRRIIVVSDGVDNKSLGYTKDELYALLKEMPVPIYTIGSKNGKNNDELENMFAISRLTSVGYFLLDETEELLDITDALNQDRDITKLTITPPEEMLDGSRKAVKITFTGGTVLTTEAAMPQQVYVEETPAPVEKEEAVEETPEEPMEEEAVEEESGSNPLIVLLAVGAIAVAAIAVAVLFIRKKKKGSNAEFETLDGSILNGLGQNAGGSRDSTEIMGSFNNRDDGDGNTVVIFRQGVAYQLVLTDVNSPAKSFQVPLNQSVIVGRKRGMCDMVLDYEQSVSGRHCEISVRDGRFYVKDLQSSNGTYLNGSKVLTESEIFSGNILKLGRLEVRFEVR